MKTDCQHPWAPPWSLITITVKFVRYDLVFISLFANGVHCISSCPCVHLKCLVPCSVHPPLDGWIKAVWSPFSFSFEAWADPGLSDSPVCAALQGTALQVCSCKGQVEGNDLFLILLAAPYAAQYAVGIFTTRRSFCPVFSLCLPPLRHPPDFNPCFFCTAAR